MIIINDSELNKYKLQNTNNRFKKIVYKETINSTNDYILNYVKSKSEEIVLISNEQTNGRGKGNRSFLSPKNKGIYMSIGLKMDKESSKLIFAITSVAIIKTLEFYNISAKIKWPNDININGRKISGILVESVCIPNQSEIFSAVGIGINLYNDESILKKLNGRASSIEKECNKYIDKTRFITHFLAYFEKLLTTQREKIISEYKKYLVKDKYQTLEFNNQQIVCKIEGITVSGIAYVRTKDAKLLYLY